MPLQTYKFFLVVAALAGTGGFSAKLLAQEIPDAALSDVDKQIQLASDLALKGRFDEAEGQYRKALKLAEDQGDIPGTAVVWHNMGWLFDREGDYLGAESAYLRAIALLHRPAAENVELMRTYIGLAAIYVQTKNWLKAERLIRETLSEVPNASLLYIATLKGELGVVLTQTRRTAEAEEPLLEAANAYLGHSDTELQVVSAIALGNLGDLRAVDGRVDEAAALYSRSLSLMRSLPGDKPEAFVTILRGNANALRRQGNWQMAESLYREGLEFGETALGAANPIVGWLLQDYASLLRQEGRKQEARAASKQAAKILTQSDKSNQVGLTVEASALARK